MKKRDRKNSTLAIAQKSVVGVLGGTVYLACRYGLTEGKQVPCYGQYIGALIIPLLKLIRP